MSAPLNVNGRMSDEELVAALQEGAGDAFTVLVGRYKDPLVNFLHRMTGDFETAVDLAQETFIRLYTRSDSYRPVARFSTWLYTIASNLARTELRRRRRWNLFGIRSEGEGTVPGTFGEPADRAELQDEQLDNVLRAERIEEALRRLPAVYREVIVLHYLQDMAYEEICTVLGIRMGTLKSRLSRGRAMLENLLPPGGGE